MSDLIFDHPRIKVYYGPWQDIGLTRDSVTKTFSDPPYTDHVHANVRSCNTTGEVQVEKYDIPFDALDNYDHVPELLRITTSWVLLFCALEQFGEYEKAAGGGRARRKKRLPDGTETWAETSLEYKGRLAAYIRSGIWRKEQAAPCLQGDRPANSCEGWALMHRRGGSLSWNGRGKHAYLSSHAEDADKPFGVPMTEEELKGVPDFIQEGREKAKKRHAAQKPEKLCQRLAELFINPGDVVLDGWAGSGNLGFAALERGASIILAETDREWAIHLADRAEEWVARLPRA